MEPAINLYSPNEKSELIRENYQEILSVLAAHQIALWEYDIITGKCSFSELGQGSTFALYLPYQEVPKEVVERRLPHKKDVKADKRKKILVVEDIESNFAQLNILLNKEYIISWVRNGQEAINSFIRESPDLILMDIRMPVMDGIQATEKIRTISLTVPIIAVTAYAFYTEQQQAIQAGCNAVISKPYSLERLRETIESYIG